MARKNFSPLSALALAAAVSLPAAAQTPKLLITNANILTMAGPIDAHNPPIAGYIAIAPDGTILTVAAGAPPTSLHATTTVDAHGDYILPGFISAHSHLWQAAYRGLAADKTLHGWIDDLYTAHATKSTPEDQYWFTLLGCLDHLERGVTTAYDFTYARPTPIYTANDYEESIFRAETTSGIRFVHSYSPARISTKDPAADIATGRSNLKAFLDWTATQPPDPRFLSVMLGGMTAFNNTEQQSVFEAAMMREFHLGNQTHFVEPPDDQGEQRSKFRWMLDSHLLGPTLIFGHFIHTDDFILKQTAAAHASMVWNPLSNGRLASGTADIPKYLKLGVRVGMGVDGEASADLADPFENMRTGLYAIRDKYEDATIMSPYQVLWLHTQGSADVLNEAAHLGSLEPGKFADMVFINPTRLGVILEDPYANIVLIAGERDIDSVYVGGDLMVDHNKLLHADIDKAQTESNRRVLSEK
jgi:5-methylthioadenosine/S-adenosylhomocysteine deaminase